MITAKTTIVWLDTVMKHSPLRRPQMKMHEFLQKHYLNHLAQT